MAKAKKGKKKDLDRDDSFSGEIAPILDQPITDTIEKNYMPYAMSVIISRAIPEIDGFKPAHRKVLYTMYKMGLMTGARTKSANVVGATMKLNPHGDSSIYETLVRLTRGHEALLHPFVDSKGSFGKQYSSEMAYAASRYTEVKLESFCSEIFGGIDKNAVDMVPNYDNTSKEPSLLPTSFPNILVSANIGVAVGLMSKICSFNLAEICDGTIAILKNPDTTAGELLDIVKAPDFPGGAYLLYNKDQLLKIYETGKGSFKLRARYVYDKQNNCIDIIQIPYTTSVEQIQDDLAKLMRADKLREVDEYRDEIDRNGFKLTLDLKKDVDPDLLMTKLYHLTSLESSFPCNFNVLINGFPIQTGIVGILKEWIRFRMECVRRELSFDLDKKKDRLHLLNGLYMIMLDIDLAIKIVRETKNDKDVVPNLMEAFSIDEVQAEFVAEIKLRNLNKEYILSRTQEIEQLQNEIEDLDDLVKSTARLKKYIAKQLLEIKKKYGIPRRTQLIFEDAKEASAKKALISQVPEYDVRLVLSKGGYLKKITSKSLQGNSNFTFGEHDGLLVQEESKNSYTALFFSDGAKVYKSSVSVFENCKASEMGTFVPSKLKFDKNEKCVFMKTFAKLEEKHNFVFVFANGKAVKVSAINYDLSRSKATAAYSTASPIVAIFYEAQPFDITMVSDAGTAITISTSLIPLKTTKTAQGTTMFELKKGSAVVGAYNAENCPYSKPSDYKRIKVPAKGIKLVEHDIRKQQTTLFDDDNK